MNNTVYFKVPWGQRRSADFAGVDDWEDELKHGRVPWQVWDSLATGGEGQILKWPRGYIDPTPGLYLRGKMSVEIDEKYVTLTCIKYLGIEGLSAGMLRCINGDTDEKRHQKYLERKAKKAAETPESIAVRQAAKELNHKCVVLVNSLWARTKAHAETWRQRELNRRIAAIDPLLTKLKDELLNEGIRWDLRAGAKKSIEVLLRQPWVTRKPMLNAALLEKLADDVHYNACMIKHLQAGGGVDIYDLYHSLRPRFREYAERKFARQAQLDSSSQAAP